MSLKHLLFDSGRHGRRTDLALLLLRICFGGAIALVHGWGKLQRLLGPEPKFADPLGIGMTPSLALATFGELVCGLLLVVGLMGRWSALIAAITLAVAFFVHHGGDPFGQKELAFTYLVAFAALAVTGPGRFSLDRLIGGERPDHLAPDRPSR